MTKSNLKLEFPKEHRNVLVQSPLSIVLQMVKHGFTFFSSVVTATIDETPSDTIHLVYSDCMFFHLEEHALIVKIEYRAYFDYGLKLHQYLNVEVMLNAAHESANFSEYQRVWKFAEEKGFLQRRREFHYAEDFEAPFIPFIEKRAEVPGWRTEGRGNYDGYITSLSSPFTSIELIDALATSLVEIKPAIGTVNNGKLAEVPADFFKPLNQSGAKGGADLWDALNTRVVRQLITKVA